MEPAVSRTMLELVTSGITTVIGWVKAVVDAIISTDGALGTLGPLFAIGISISAILLGIKLVKSLVWGS